MNCQNCLKLRRHLKQCKICKKMVCFECISGDYCSACVTDKLVELSGYTPEYLETLEKKLVSQRSQS